jgi:hypothetical protein
LASTEPSPLGGWKQKEDVSLSLRWEEREEEEEEEGRKVLGMEEEEGTPRLPWGALATFVNIPEEREERLRCEGNTKKKCREKIDVPRTSSKDIKKIYKKLDSEIGIIFRFFVSLKKLSIKNQKIMGIFNIYSF